MTPLLHFPPGHAGRADTDTTSPSDKDHSSIERRRLYIDTVHVTDKSRDTPILDLPRVNTKSIPPPRPDAVRRCSTDPSPNTALLQSYFNTTTPTPLKSSSPHRNRSPYSRSHLRTRSSGAALVTAPLMTRAHSSPGPFDLANSISSISLAPSSPMRTPARQRSPFRPIEDSNGNPIRPRSPSWREPSTSSGAIQSIQEDSELDITPRQPLAQFSPLPAPFGRSSSLRRRPASPLHSVLNAASTPPTYLHSDQPPSAGTSASGSPTLAPQRYLNETYPSLHSYASSSSFSSHPSTPTSTRSRSPSISSLETIEDAPDLESEATEAERILRLKLAAERAERAENGEEADGGRRRSSLDVPRGFGFGSRGGSARERKRWSVCGAERRGDLDLETIWED
ncbi:unnamed protein product [Zymoseptoria tritici ST99CH_3D1]|nr:unnamed protein product [Zymoseptoria tritici ST99CH_3D1]